MNSKRTYLYLSIVFTLLFLIGNYFFRRKAIENTKELMNLLIKSNLQTKSYVFSKDLDDFDKHINTKKINDYVSSSKNIKELQQLLIENINKASNNDYIDNCILIMNKGGADTILFKTTKTNPKTTLNDYKKLQNSNNYIYRKNDTTYIRKIAVCKKDDTDFLISYEINLIRYWKVFSETYTPSGYYIILCNSEGICLLHPDARFIGKKLDFLFSKHTIKKIINSNYSKQFLDKQLSNYLQIEVYRNYNVITTNESKEKYILISNYPVDFFYTKNIDDITKYFSIVNFLSIISFTIIFFFSIYRLQKAFDKSLQKEKEKQKLAIQNQWYKEANSLLQLNQLKKKMNPHFLFNSLNSLVVLIDNNKELSKQFVLKLADVYRYFLENPKKNLVSVQKELSFLKQYFFLHKMRFNNSVQLNINEDIPSKSLFKKIPFLSLETLIENAIKHNKISKKEPLIIDCIINEHNITVSNNYNPLKTTTTKRNHKVGLKYIENCYNFYGNKSFKVEIKNGKFVCYLPLLTIQ